MVLLLLLAMASPAFATSVSQPGDAKLIDLRWRSGPITVAISASLLRENSNVKHDSDVAGAIRRSFETWSRVANVELREVPSDKLSASAAGPAGDGVSLITIAQTPENVLLFAKDPEGVAATTRVFYNRRGVITEADIVLNPYQQFSTDGTFGTFDLESTLTHEIGHLLGLGHSEVRGSTMFENYGRNGVLGVPRFMSRSLSADDIAAVRAIYGVRREDEACCGRIQGELIVPGKQIRTIDVWIEDSSGRVYGSSRVSASGEYSFAGLDEGNYRVFAQEAGRAKNALHAQPAGTALVKAGETTEASARTILAAGDLELNYLGINGQLSEMAVALSPGRSYVVYLGGRNLDPKELQIK
jgi:hypothetical protein